MNFSRRVAPRPRGAAGAAKGKNTKNGRAAGAPPGKFRDEGMKPRPKGQQWRKAKGADGVNRTTMKNVKNTATSHTVHTDEQM